MVGGLFAGGEGLYSPKVLTKKEDDIAGRLALAQLLIDGIAPQEILDLLATNIVPDYDPPGGVKLPAQGIPLSSSLNPQRLLPSASPRRLDFKFRTGSSRKRGAPSIQAPYKEGSILTKVAERIRGGSTKTKAFSAVGAEVCLSPEAVRSVWTKHSQLVDFLWGDSL